MTLFWVSRKKIRHLSRYFGFLGLICFIGYSYVAPSFSRLFLIFLGPPFFLTAWLRDNVRFLATLIPNEPFFNNFFLLLPITILYFGFIGFQLKNIVNETGRMRIFILAVFVGFLTYIHYLAFQEINLYWE